MEIITIIKEKVKFKNLGLVIIDEEHRFGVRQKEQLKKMRAEVDVLTLTATPYPAHTRHVIGRVTRFLYHRNGTAKKASN